MPLCRDTVGSTSLKSILKIFSYVMQITLKVNSAYRTSSFSHILTLLQVSDKWQLIGTDNSIIVCGGYNSHIRSYELCTYILDHISSHHKELRLGLIRKILLICRLQSGMTMPYM